MMRRFDRSTSRVPGSDPLQPVCFSDREVLLTRASLRIRRRSHSLELVSEVRTHHDPPRIVPPLLVAALASAVGVPSIAAYGSSASTGGASLTGLALLASSAALFGSILWLLTATDRYCLVLVRTGGSETVMRSSDYQWVVRVAAEIQSVLAELRASGGRVGSGRAG